MGLRGTQVAKETAAMVLKNDSFKSIVAAIEQGRIIFQNIKRLKDIRSYRGSRHKAGLTVRGQNTRGNTKTRKGRGRAVGGLKIKVTK